MEIFYSFRHSTFPDIPYKNMRICIGIILKLFSSFKVYATALEGINGPITSRKWLSKQEKKELSTRIEKFSVLEDLVKHELMKRVQESINKSFYDSCSTNRPATRAKGK